VTEGEAKELGVSVNEGEVAKQVKTREEAQKRYAKNSRYAELGLTYNTAELTELTRSGLLEQQVSMKIREKFAKPGSLSQSTLEKYYNEHKQLYGTPEERHLQILYTKSEAQGKQARQEIQSGKSFATVAASVTKSKFATPTTETFGCQQTATGARSEGILASVCAAKKGVLTGPVKTFSQYVVFEVTGITAAVQPSFAQAKERIKQLLSSQGESQATLKHNEEAREKWKAHTECAKGYVVELCKEYVTPKPVLPTKTHP
jgi:parvulin-like peptidyl-prolyl isomerase